MRHIELRTSSSANGLKITLVNIHPVSFDFMPKERSIWSNCVAFDTPETIKIIASSGSGKSSLLSFLSGLRGDYAGEILYNGANTRVFTSAQWGSLRSTVISMVYQDLRLFRKLTARQNIQLSQEISDSMVDSVTLDDMAEKLAIREHLDKEAGKLSFGQMQRVAILRAITRNFKWLILDEPFSHLDKENASAAWDLILKQAQLRHAGIIVACLDPYDFINADRIYQL